MTEPIFLQGICKDYLWGGNRLREEYGKKSDADKIAESWELACHKDGSSILTTGADAGKDLREYLDEHGTGFLGTNCAGCTTVPVLIKLIDAKQDLSIQVHPDDDYAMRVEGEPGKTEMWYIMDAAPGAALYYGLNRAVSKEEFAKRIQEQTLTEILNRVEVKPGELYFIPSGTLHAIGAGILLAEIQQNSNTTFRVYDYRRRGADGQLRPLHLDRAAAVLRYTPMAARACQPLGVTAHAGWTETALFTCDYFSAARLDVETRAALTCGGDSFRHLLCVEGEGAVVHGGVRYLLRQGDSYFLPAALGDYAVEGPCRVLLSRV